MKEPLGWLVWLASVDVQMSLQSFRSHYTSRRAVGNLFFLFGFILNSSRSSEALIVFGELLLQNRSAANDR